MPNDIDEMDCNPRSHSPPSLDEAELLHFVSKRFSDRPLSPPLAQVSKEALYVTAQSPAAATSTSFANETTSSTSQRLAADEEDDSDADYNLTRVNCTADGKLHIKDSFTSPNQRHRVNRPVDHTYTDYAVISDDELRILDQDSSVLSSPALSLEKKRLLGKLKEMPCRSAGGVTQSFPSKLHQVLANNELSEVISWMPHGRCFVIHQSEVLATEVLPRFFNQTEFLSFIRQLNLWGFKRLTRGVDGKAYYHELFLRGRPYLALRLKRMKIKGRGFKPIPNPTGEPNFYNRFPPVGGVTTMGISSGQRKTSSPKAKEDKGLCTKNQGVMNRAETVTNDQTKMICLGNHSLSLEDATKTQPQSCGAGIGGILMNPTLIFMTPARTDFNARLQATGLDVGDTCTPDDVNLAEMADPKPLVPMNDVTCLLPAHAASAPDLQNSSQLAALTGLEPLAVAVLSAGLPADCLQQGAAPASDHVVGLGTFMTASDLQNSAILGLYDYFTPRINNGPLTDKGFRLQRNREDMWQNVQFKEACNGLSNANMVFIPCNDRDLLVHSTGYECNCNHGRSQRHSSFSNGSNPSIPSLTHIQNTALTSTFSLKDSGVDLIQLSVLEALREAKRLEDLAMASRARARSLAMAGRLKSQSRYPFAYTHPLQYLEKEVRLATYGEGKKRGNLTEDLSSF